MAVILNEEIINEEIRMKNLKPRNPNIKNYLGSEKITETTFSGFKHHKDNIVPYPPLKQQAVASSK